MSKPKVYPPGSQEACDAGCTCPVIDNNHGAGVVIYGRTRMWWKNGECPLHGLETDTHPGIWRGGKPVRPSVRNLPEPATQDARTAGCTCVDEGDCSWMGPIRDLIGRDTRVVTIKDDCPLHGSPSPAFEALLDAVGAKPKEDE